MKKYVTALYNLSRLPNTVGNRLWKWYVTTYGNGKPPLMEMAADYLSYYFIQPD
jgi:hypothetical protein